MKSRNKAVLLEKSSAFGCYVDTVQDSKEPLVLWYTATLRGKSDVTMTSSFSVGLCRWTILLDVIDASTREAVASRNRRSR